MSSSAAPQPDRLPALDVLRGLAILGTLATNIWIFTDPEGLVGLLAGGDLATAGPWQPVETVLRQLANGKFLGLLTVLFGIGLAIQHASALRRGRPWPGRYSTRAGLLLLEGTLHYLLIAEFDILMGYALTGFVVARLLTSSDAVQRRWAAAAAALHLALLTVASAVVLLDPAVVSASAPLVPNPYADGSFLDLVAFRVENVALFRAEVVFILPLSTALFLLGVRLYRAGVLEARGAALRRRLLLLGACALPVDLALGTFGGVAGTLVTRYGTGPVVALGLLALVVEVVARRPRAGALRRRLSAVGRTALSCYVLQNLLASSVCYGWGLGLAAQLGDARVPATVGLWSAICVLLLVLAPWWLRRHDRGPLEAAAHQGYEWLTARVTPR